MKTSLLLIALMTFTVAGCGRTTVRESKETIREQPVQVAEQPKQIVIQTPVVTRQILVEQPLNSPQRVCTYSSSSFFPGTLSCQNGQQVRCDDGIWVSKGAC